jgi:hypothetical protein
MKMVDSQLMAIPEVWAQLWEQKILGVSIVRPFNVLNTMLYDNQVASF